LGELKRSIQSVPAFIRCTLQINVIQYFGCFIIVKWIAAFVAGTWVMLAALIFRRAFTGWCAALAFIGSNLLIRSAVSAVGKYNVVKYTNLVSMLFTNELLGSHHNLFWFGVPVSRIWVESLAAVLMCTAFVTIFIYIFTFGQILPPEHKKPFFPFFKFKAKINASTLVGQEIHKLLIINGAVWVLLLFVGIQVYASVIRESYIGINEIYYREYMTRLSGRFTQEKLDWLNTEQEKFEPIFLLDAELAKGNITEEQHESLMAHYASLQTELEVFKRIVSKKIGYLSENPDAHLVYDSGYSFLFGITGEKDMEDALWAGLISAVCFASFFAMEKSTGMLRVIQATPLGRQSTVWAKSKICWGIATFIAVMTLLPRAWQVGHDYQYSSIFSPAMSLEYFQRLPSCVPILVIILLLLFTRIIACFSTAMTVLFISYKLGNTLGAIFTSSLLFCVGPLLSFCGVIDAKWISIYPLFHFAALQAETMTSVISWIYLLLYFAIGVICQSYLLEHFGEAF